MTYYLVDNPPRRSQFRRVRRSPASGTIVLHSTESLADVNPPDTGAENVARFIRDRTDPGSYHRLCDSDTTVKLVPFTAEAFHDGTGTNPHSVGISGAFRAHQFAALPQHWRTGVIRQMALAAREAADWVHETTGVVVPARRISVAQARARVPGFVTHGMLDPHRRSDPDGTNTGARFPWTSFFEHYDTAAPEAPLEDDMAPHVERILAGYRRVRGATYDPRVKDANGWDHWMEKLQHAKTADDRNGVVFLCLALLAHEAGL